MWPLTSALSSRKAVCGAVWVFGLYPLIAQPLQASDTAGIPSGVPRLAKEASEKARDWRGDAWLVRIVLTKDHESQTADAFRLSFRAFSRAERAGLVLSGTPVRSEVEQAPYEVDESILIPVPDFAVDLPQALMVAERAGMRGQLEEATLAVKIPLAKPPVLVWSIRSRDELIASTYFVDAFTGAYLDGSHLVDPRAKSDIALEEAARSLKEALLRQPPAPAQSTNPWMDFVVIPILNAKNVFECNALGGQWRLKICLP